jgi:acetylornithine deacetylase
MRARVLEHLDALLRCDSQNPPRDLTADDPLFSTVEAALGPGFDIEVTDHGDGHVTLHAVRGAPTVLFNCHLDTVPVGEGWSVDPLALTVRDERAWGRGSCDIKGAAAVLLALAERDDAPLALLFTTDEEGSNGCCVQRFLDSPAAANYRQAVVCEPTGNRAVFSHRGYLSVRGRFHGTAGHSSEPRALADSANHRAVRWAAAALAHCEQAAADGAPTCFNLGTLTGGGKSNVIADRCDLHWSARLAPGADNDALLAALTPLADADRHADWQVPFSGPPLPAAGRDEQAARAFAAAHRLPTLDRVAFWTEASLFSQAGIPALVLGPGHIEQAHTVDEWVALAQLDEAVELYARVLAGRPVCP